MTIKIINELRKCTVPATDDQGASVWDVWFRGHYLGTITKANKYICIREAEREVGIRDSFMAAISSFINDAKVVINNEIKTKLSQEPALKQIGKPEPKSLWQKIKGWF